MFRLMQALLLCCAFNLLAGEPPAELKVPKAAAAPKIDGKLDDPAWKDAASADKFTLNFGEKTTVRTRLLVTQDDKNIYLAMECFDGADEIKNLRASVTEHDGEGIWDDDAVEFFMDPHGKKGAEYYQLIVNTKGVTWEAVVTDPATKEHDLAWNPAGRAQVSVGKESWIAEVSLPLSSFSRAEKIADTWTFNAARDRSANSESHYWSPPHDKSSHVPEKFGILSGISAKK